MYLHFWAIVLLVLWVLCMLVQDAVLGLLHKSIDLCVCVFAYCFGDVGYCNSGGGYVDHM